MLVGQTPEGRSIGVGDVSGIKPSTIKSLSSMFRAVLNSSYHHTRVWEALGEKELINKLLFLPKTPILPHTYDSGIQDTHLSDYLHHQEDCCKRKRRTLVENPNHPRILVSRAPYTRIGYSLQ